MFYVCSRLYFLSSDFFRLLWGHYSSTALPNDTIRCWKEATQKINRNTETTSEQTAPNTTSGRETGALPMALGTMVPIPQKLGLWGVQLGCVNLNSLQGLRDGGPSVFCNVSVLLSTENQTTPHSTACHPSQVCFVDSLARAGHLLRAGLCKLRFFSLRSHIFHTPL